jgi:hypothetical protein
MDLGEGLIHDVKEGASPQPLQPVILINLQPVAEMPKQSKLTATRKTAGPKQPERKSAAAIKPADGKSKKKAAAIVKTTDAKHPNAT